MNSNSTVYSVNECSHIRLINVSIRMFTYKATPRNNITFRDWESRQYIWSRTDIQGEMESITRGEQAAQSMDVKCFYMFPTVNIALTISQDSLTFQL